MAKDWGKITWFLFHGMLEKISNENFVKHRIMIIELIVEICSLLPCPTCQQHATNHVKFIHRVTTLAELRKFMFMFHNFVNEKTNKPVVNENELLKYKNINMKRVLSLFYKVYERNRYNNRNFNEQMARKRLVYKMRKFFNENPTIFD